LCKPFAFEELLARVRALARRPAHSADTVLSHADVRLDLAARCTERAGKPLDLTAKEEALLVFFLRHPGEVLSRTRIYEGVWDERYDGLSNTLEVHVMELRKKLEAHGPRLIHTIRGRGYRFGGAPVSLTTRLSLFFLAALAVVLVAFSLTLYLLADVHLHRQLDDRLEAAARTLSSAAEVEPDGVEWEPGVRPLALSHGSFGDHLCWAVTTDEGRVIGRSKQPEAEELLAAARAAPGEYGRPHRLVHAGRAWRVIRLRLAPEPAPLPRQVRPEKLAALTLTVAVPLEPVQTTLRTLAAALTGLMLVVLVVALIAGRAVCRRAVAPVARMADAARSMGAADLHDRLPVPPSADELADLGTAFNGLLERLAEAFERERRFAGEASHQLRTPLAGLIGQVEVALRRDRP